MTLHVECVFVLPTVSIGGEKYLGGGTFEPQHYIFYGKYTTVYQSLMCVAHVAYY